MRSFMSCFASGILRITCYKPMINNTFLCDKYMQYCSRVSAKPYKIPASFGLKAQIRNERFADTDIVYLHKKNCRPHTMILYLHGGAYLEQPVLFQWKFIDKLVNDLNVGVVAPIYNKTPVHTYEQSFAMLDAVYEQMLAKIKPEKIIFLGDSSGGGLTLAFAQQLVQKQLPLPQQLILLSPWLDVSMENNDMKAYDRVDPSLGIKGLRQFAQAWAGNTDLHDPALSPLFGSNTGLPKVSVFVGDREIFLPDCRLYREKALEEGVELTYVEQSGVNHCYPFYPIPEAATALKQIENLIQNGRI